MDFVFVTHIYSIECSCVLMDMEFIQTVDVNFTYSSPEIHGIII